MSRPRKRPRLQLIGSASPEPDVELEAARRENDEVLKARWESIFERYGRDFTGVGDEIGNVSGQIEVDNGHIRGMHEDANVEEDSSDQPRFNGKRMLRAMTVAPSEYSGSVSEDEDIFQSIETIRGNALLSEVDSEDDFTEEQSAEPDEHTRRHFTSEHVDKITALAQDARVQGYAMNTSRPRSSSPDSLFDVDQSAAMSADPYSGAEQVDLRTQVMQILQEEKEQALERAEEEIEPAWRLPIYISSLTPNLTRHSPPARNVRQPRREDGPSSGSEGSQERKSKQKKRKPAVPIQIRLKVDDPSEIRRSQKAVAAERNIRSIRAVSEDPLQEGFSSGPERQRPVKKRPRKDIQGQVGQSERTARFSYQRSTGNSSHLEASDDEFVASEDGGSELESDFEEAEIDRTHRRVKVIIERPRGNRRALIAKYRPKDGERQTSRPNMPRFSAPETAADRMTHPWHSPTTRDGKPLNFKAAAQRKTLNAKFSTIYTGNKDPVTEKLNREKVLRPMEKGICVYCNNNHTNKNGVGSHWDRVLTNFVAETLDKNDPHDIEFIHEVRRRVERRIRPPVTRLLDFSTMVRMYEGQGKSFEQILKSNLLFTTKNPLQLEKEFRVWRQIPEERQAHHQWTDIQVDHLRELMREQPQSSRHSLTLIRIHRLVGHKAGMDYSDVGNKIADIIMESGDYTVRLPMQPQVAVDEEVIGPTLVNGRVSPKNGEVALIDPAILQTRAPQLGEDVSEPDIEETAQNLALARQSGNGLSDLYKQLASYANEQSISNVQDTNPTPTGPIDMAPRY